LPVEAIAQVVRSLPPVTDPNLLVGAEGFSDAGIYRIHDTLALVQTVDFFPPVVDDPYAYGQIAAANSLSDVYAMGGEPKTVLNIVGFPDNKLPMSVLEEILRGGAERVTAAGAVILGGHSVRDAEIKFGLSVTGFVDPAKMMTNRAAKPGDVLVLTKALGTGFITTANRKGECPADVLAAAVDSMTQLNRDASRAAVSLGARAATDITGFALAGHGGEMAESSGVTLRFHIDALPALPGALDLAKAGHLSRANKSNREFVEKFSRFDVADDRALLLFDPQTSGGLLVALAADRADEFVQRCRAAGMQRTAIVGEVLKRQDNLNLIVG